MTNPPQGESGHILCLADEHTRNYALLWVLYRLVHGTSFNVQRIVNWLRGCRAHGAGRTVPQQPSEKDENRWIKCLVSTISHNCKFTAQHIYVLRQNCWEYSENLEMIHIQCIRLCLIFMVIVRDAQKTLSFLQLTLQVYIIIDFNNVLILIDLFNQTKCCLQISIR